MELRTETKRGGGCEGTRLTWKTSVNGAGEQVDMDGVLAVESIM